MARILYIQASPLHEFSFSTAVADAFVESYLQQNPQDQVLRLDVFRRPLIAFDGPVLRAKYAILHGRAPSREEKKAWEAVEEAIAEFRSADNYVMAVPMWNFGIPYRLKQYVDILVQPGYTFEVTPGGGFKGLVVGKPIFIAYARGGEYPAGSPYEGFDLQKRYLETILAFIGFRDFRSVIVEPTLNQGPEVAQGRRNAAVEKAREMARSF